MIAEKYKQRIETAQIVCTDLSKKFQTSICAYDRTAVLIGNITEKQLEKICKELHCSGIYSEPMQSGIITNFGLYN